MHNKVMNHLAVLLLAISVSWPALADTLVFGGTRGVGLETVRQLRDNGTAVTVMVRATSDLTELNAIDGVNTTIGDAMEMASVTEAFAAGEFDTVISTLGGSLKSGFEVDSVGNVNAIDGAKAAGAMRYILVTSIGAGDSRAAAPGGMLKALAEVLAGKDVAERHLIDSGLKWTIIRPGTLHNKANDYEASLTQDTTAVGVINRAKVARLVVESIGREETFGRIYSALEDR
jgi:uncharacterized protein YbjT (DUF2867 family)